MKRKMIAKILYILVAVLLLVGCISLAIDYSRYDATLNSAPFSLWVWVTGIECGLPAVILCVVAYFLGRPRKEEK